MSKKVKVQYVDYLMWVGSGYYPEVNDFIAEAQDRGVCKRIGTVPMELREAMVSEDKTARVFLAHDDGATGEGFVFGYFLPEAIQAGYKDKKHPPTFKWCFPVHIGELKNEPDRACGGRFEGFYLVEWNAPQTKEVPFEKSRETFQVLKSPVSLEVYDEGRKRFRGMLRIDYGQKMISNRLKKNRLTPPSWEKADPVDGPFSVEEDTQIWETLNNSANRTGEAQRLAYRTGRTKAAILYRFKTLVELEEDAMLDEE